ncbi:OmpA family protein [Ideonella sp. 4Y11]|uniref:OmpA family protein n=1 Tax=Ideonella aquatica TaxID=2824119 RepID=A0A940YSC6_9BURK|nr:OmpA family protein [Ideonella aquatica]MBQ0961576.1 OmpA family protein [Ideonella aquatica]
MVLALGCVGGQALAADDGVELGNKVPSANDIEQGLFPDDECEQLKAAGFKCMGFKPPVRFSLPAATFKLGSAELPEVLRQQLDAFANVLRNRRATDRKVRVEGHADASGDMAANLELSQRRADAAKQYLVDKGVSPDLVMAVGMGAKQLKDPRNPNAAENRRVVIGREQP